MEIHVNDVLRPEIDKYQEIWGHEAYHRYSPGQENVKRFMEVVHPSSLSRVIDLGCGAGLAGIELRDEFHMMVHWLDIVGHDELNEKVDKRRFIKSALWQDWPSPARIFDWGFCCDVLEHVPTEYTMLSIANILRGCLHAWLQIAFVPDSMGQLINKPLHLTVQPFTWWRDRIASLGKLTDARDLGQQGLFVVERY